VGPIDPANGFPAWYVDGNGLTLELCLSQTGFCFTEEPNPAIPISFPDNFTAEGFYFLAEVSMDLPGGGQALLVLALESSFLNGAVVNGEQIVFARIRVRIDTPQAGNYRVIHPYGTETFVDAPAGVRGINFTEDIGVGVAGDFAAALGSRIGPFLESTGGRVVDALGAVYLANPNVPTTVTGSPAGNNKFRIEGPGIGGPGVDFIESDQFTLMGKVLANAPPPPPPGSPPTALPDTASTNVNSAVIISVLANDTDPDNNIDPGTVAIVAPPAKGTAAVSANGTVTYTPFALLTGTDTFQYTVSDATGLVSNAASVTVTINPEVIAVNRAEFRQALSRWIVSGTSTVPGPRNTITVHLGPTLAGPVIGTARVNRAGNWLLNVRRRLLPPDGTRTISVESTTGASVLAVPITISP
jgi:hypothetical protein